MWLVSSSTSWRSTMSERLGLFPAAKIPVLSLGVQAEAVAAHRQQSQFEVLVRHLLYRFFHNELLASDDETKRVMQISYAVALPGLLVALFLFPAYHGFPPYPLHRPFWSQAADHYFYVMYSFIVMGAATVYEWDLLFPDLLDIFVLSPLPIPRRRLFFARVLALTIFLMLVLLGTSALGTIFLPLVAEQSNFPRHLFSHAVAVTMSGAFAATYLSCTSGLATQYGWRTHLPTNHSSASGRIHHASPHDPAALSNPFPIAQGFLTSGSPTIRYFPPFWFLGIYERLLAGPSAAPVFDELARIGFYALFVMLACTLLTYPLAYRRRVRQLIEGASAVATNESRCRAFALPPARHNSAQAIPESNLSLHQPDHPPLSTPAGHAGDVRRPRYRSRSGRNGRPARHSGPYPPRSLSQRHSRSNSDRGFLDRHWAPLRALRTC